MGTCKFSDYILGFFFFGHQCSILFLLLFLQQKYQKVKLRNALGAETGNATWKKKVSRQF